MNVGSRHGDVIDRVLADLARADVSGARADTIRSRMHARLARQTHRGALGLPGTPFSGWARALPRSSVRTVAACTAALVIYIAGVIRHALQLYGR